MYNTWNKVLRGRNIYWYYEKCTRSISNTPKAIYNRNSTCVKIQLVIGTYMTERKTGPRKAVI